MINDIKCMQQIKKYTDAYNALLFTAKWKLTRAMNTPRAILQHNASSDTLFEKT